MHKQVVTVELPALSIQVVQVRLQRPRAVLAVEIRTGRAVIEGIRHGVRLIMTPQIFLMHHQSDDAAVEVELRNPNDSAEVVELEVTFGEPRLEPYVDLSVLLELMTESRRKLWVSVVGAKASLSLKRAQEIHRFLVELYPDLHSPSKS